MTKSRQTLLDEIISFLEQEKELYGSFSTETEEEGSQTESATTPNPSEDETETTLPSSSESQNTGSTPSVEKKTHQRVELSLDEQLKACSTLQELEQFCAESEQLQTDLDGTNLVFGVGNPCADLMIVGEAPGFNEDQQGEPFVGAAGQLLNKILIAIEFDRDDVYIANILKHRPPDNRNPTAEERERSLPFLERQIDLISPKVILCVGKVSGTTLLGKDDALKRMRGQFYDYRGAKLTVTYHPAALLRNPKWKRPVWEDVQQVRTLYDKLGGKP